MRIVIDLGRLHGRCRPTAAAGDACTLSNPPGERMTALSIPQLAAAVAEQLATLEPDHAVVYVVPYGLPAAERADLLDTYGALVAELRRSRYPGLRSRVRHAPNGTVLELVTAEETTT